MLYSPNYNEWEQMQNHIIDEIVNEPSGNSNKTFDPDHFNFRGINYDMFDIWGLSCEHLINNDEYKQMCLNNGWTSPSAKFFKTSAETTYRYFKGDNEFVESHTALAAFGIAIIRKRQPPVCTVADGAGKVIAEGFAKVACPHDESS